MEGGRRLWIRKILLRRCIWTYAGLLKQLMFKLGVSQCSARSSFVVDLHERIVQNDIIHMVKDCSIKLFADDTLIYISGKHVEESVLKNEQ
jgi:hypothetical protein